MHALPDLTPAVGPLAGRTAVITGGGTGIGDHRRDPPVDCGATAVDPPTTAYDLA